MCGVGIIYRPLYGVCVADVPYGGRYARRARGNGLYGRGDRGEMRGGRGDIGTKKNTLPRDIGILLFC